MVAQEYNVIRCYCVLTSKTVFFLITEGEAQDNIIFGRFSCVLTNFGRTQCSYDLFRSDVEKMQHSHSSFLCLTLLQNNWRAVFNKVRFQNWL